MPSSSCTDEFWRLYRALPRTTRNKARQAFQHWIADPRYPGVRFKLIDAEERIYSARVDDDYRCLCFEEGGEYTWYWIGPHDEYEALIKR